MAAISYSGPISAIPTIEQLLRQKATCTTFQIVNSKTMRVVHVYTERQTDEHGLIV